MSIIAIDPGHPEVLLLLRQSDEYMASLYPPESNHMESVEGLRQPNVGFFGAMVDGKVAGCGGVKIMMSDKPYGELKRLFVSEDHRGMGIATRIIERLESHLLTSSVSLARLEVGIEQPNAIALYERLGYRKRGPFGDYRADPLSVFMEKRLGDAAEDS